MPVSKAPRYLSAYGGPTGVESEGGLRAGFKRSGAGFALRPKPALIRIIRLGYYPSVFFQENRFSLHTALLWFRGGKPALRERGFTKITIAWPGGNTSSDWSVGPGSAVKREWNCQVVGNRAIMPRGSRGPRFEQSCQLHEWIPIRRLEIGCAPPFWPGPEPCAA